MSVLMFVFSRLMKMIAQMEIIPIYRIVTPALLKLANYVREPENVAPILAWTIVMDIVRTAEYNVEVISINPTL